MIDAISSNRGQIEKVAEVWRNFGMFCKAMNLTPYSMPFFRDAVEKAWGYYSKTDSNYWKGYEARLDRENAGADFIATLGDIPGLVADVRWDQMMRPTANRAMQAPDAWGSSVWRRRLSQLWETVNGRYGDTDLYGDRHSGGYDGYNPNTVVFGLKEDLRDNNIGCGFGYRDSANVRRLNTQCHAPTVEGHRVFLQQNGDVAGGIPYLDRPGNLESDRVGFNLDGNIASSTGSSSVGPDRWWKSVIFDGDGDWQFTIPPALWYYDLLMKPGAGVGLDLRIDGRPVSIVEYCFTKNPSDLVREVRRSVVIRNKRMSVENDINLSDLPEEVQRRYLDARQERLGDTRQAMDVARGVGEVAQTIASVNPWSDMIVGALRGVTAVAIAAIGVSAGRSNPIRVDVFGRLMPAFEIANIYDTFQVGGQPSDYEVWRDGTISADEEASSVVSEYIRTRETAWAQFLIDPTATYVVNAPGLIRQEQAQAASGGPVKRTVTVAPLPAFAHVFFGSRDLMNESPPSGSGGYVGQSFKLGAPWHAQVLTIRYQDGQSKDVTLPVYDGSEVIVDGNPPQPLGTPSDVERRRSEELLRLQQQRLLEIAEQDARRTRNLVIGVSLVALVAGGAYFWTKKNRSAPTRSNPSKRSVVRRRS